MTERTLFPTSQYHLTVYSTETISPETAALLTSLPGVTITQEQHEAEKADLLLYIGKEGLSLKSGGQTMRCDLTRMIPRLKPTNLSQELLIRAAKIKNAHHALTAVDATAGLGEDSLLLAAAGFSVTLYERNPIIALLLKDALNQALKVPELTDIVKRMSVCEADSIAELPRLAERPDVVYLDPMFPAKYKNALTKKKFQILHHLELPCTDEELLLQAAMQAKPHKIVIKRPLKGAFLGNRKPDYSLKGKAVRYDCILLHES